MGTMIEINIPAENRFCGAGRTFGLPNGESFQDMCYKK